MIADCIHHGSIDDPEMLARYLAAVRRSRE
jgi:hypothetical protein